MGSGGSKTKPKTSSESPKKAAPKTPGKGAGSRAPSSRSKKSFGGVGGTPRHSQDSSGGDVGQDRPPPKGVRKHSLQTNKSEVSRPDYYSTGFDNENLPLEGNWELESGVDTTTPISDISYPQPKGWKPIPDRQNFVPIDFDTLQRNDFKQANGTFVDVATDLTKNFTTDLLKVRALTTWISCQKIRTRQYGPEAKPDTVAGYMKQIKEGTGTFAGLLTNLCRPINIPCVILKGVYKSAHHLVGEDDMKTFRTTWNAVHVDGGWQLVHPYLMCTPQANKSPAGDWTLLQSSSKEFEPPPGHVLNTFFFAPKPEQFIYCCIPDAIQSYWQLMETRIQYHNFLKKPFLRPAFFQNNMELKSKEESVIFAEKGMVLIRIKCDAVKIKTIEFSYELYTLDEELENVEGWGKLVFAGRTEGMLYIQVKFPEEGTFKLALYGQLPDWFFWLGDFKIIVDQPMDPFVPFPEVSKDVGWGPTSLTSDSGLIEPSHAGGIVFYKPNEEHTIKFLMTEKLKLRCQLENADIDTEDLEEYAKLNTKRGEVDITVTIPLSGEFVLLVFKVGDNEEETNICNYLFVDWDDGRKRENVFQRRARGNVRKAATGHDVVVMEQTLHKFKEVKLDHDDDDYIRGNKRYTYLSLKKKLREAEMRRHEQTLFDAINEAESSPCQQSLQPNITRCRDMLESLQELEMHSHPVRELDHVTISEIANLAHPPSDVHETMIAMYLLLGEDKLSLKRWGYIQALLRRRGREGLKARIDQFSQEPNVEDATVRAAQRVFDRVMAKYVLSASLSAMTFYNWVAGTLGCLQNTSQNALDSTYDELDDELAISIKDEEDGDETLSQDEGFLDSNDTNSSNRRDSENNIQPSASSELTSETEQRQ